MNSSYLKFRSRGLVKVSKGRFGSFGARIKKEEGCPLVGSLSLEVYGFAFKAGYCCDLPFLGSSVSAPNSGNNS